VRRLENSRVPADTWKPWALRLPADTRCSIDEVPPADVGKPTGRDRTVPEHL
jgi:hypothetical protein